MPGNADNSIIEGILSGEIGMSVGLYQYRGNLYEDAEEILSVNIASQRMWDNYLEPAVKELKIHYFQDGAQIRKENLAAVMSELELLIRWITNYVEGSDLEYLLYRLKNIKEVISKSLEKDDDILYIF